MANTVGVRRSIQEIMADYKNGNKKPLDDVIRAWSGIQELAYRTVEQLVSENNVWNSFFMLGGLHGEPLQLRDGIGVASPDDADAYAYWGGWCNHGNVLFPTWHRVYLYRLEQALQSIVPGVMLPYWDETSLDSLQGGVPEVFHWQTYELDGRQIPNPLYSFTFPRGLTDGAPGDSNEYTKPARYTTVRYPLSGLVGTPEAKAETEAHNGQYLDPQKNAQLLNDNVKAWLAGAGAWTDPKAGPTGPTSQDPNPKGDGVYWMYKNCLDAPNYTVFSNITSAAEWNQNNPGTVVALEMPHNDIHLSIGGFDLPGPQGGESGQIAGSNGDMGENNTAALDPIFFFHHCNVDRMFWVWQKKHGCTEKLDVIADYRGTSASDFQGPTPDFFPGDTLNLNSPLSPFKKSDGTVFTSNEAVNIETQLGYTYSKGSLDDEAISLKAINPAVASDKKIAVTGIDRSLFRGSFVIHAYAKVKGGDGGQKTYYLGHYSVLSRGDTLGCANCLTHLEVQAHFPLTNVPPEERGNAEYSISIQHRGRHVVIPESGVGRPMIVKSANLPDRLAYKIELKD